MPSSLEIIYRLKAIYAKLTRQYAGHAALLLRLDRAMDLLVKDSDYTFKYADKEWYISKYGSLARNQEPQEYVVSLRDKSCTCPDAENGNICKHRMACMMLDTLD